MNVIRVRLPHRNTKSFEISVLGVQMLVSYETVVAARYKGVAIRRRNSWGPTTGRHMSDANVKGYAEVEEDEFNAEVRNLLFKAASDDLTKEMPQ